MRRLTDGVRSLARGWITLADVTGSLLLKNWIGGILAGAAALAIVGPAVALKAAVRSQQASASVATPDVTKLGPQVGQKVPDFSLVDQHGRARTLQSLMGPNGLVLVFNRSADW